AGVQLGNPTRSYFIVVAKGYGEQRAGGMRRRQRLVLARCKIVAIDDKKIAISNFLFQLLQRPGCPQQLALLRILDPDAPASTAPEVFPNDVTLVMEVDPDFFNAGRRKLLDVPLQERLATDP